MTGPRGFAGRRLTLAALAVSIAVLALGVSVWIGERPVEYGKATPLSLDAPLREAVCAIRSEVEALESPLVRRHVFHERWTETRFAAGRFSYGPFHEIVPSDAVRALLRRHTGPELVAALAPMLADAEVGGRAAVVLASLPVAGRTALGRTTTLAEAVKAAQGGRATAPVRWDPARGPELIAPLTLSYGLTNMGGHSERPNYHPRRDTFEARLETVLQDAARLPLRFIAERPAPRARYETVEALIAAEPVPEPDEVFAEFLQRHDPEAFLIALLPLVGSGGNVGGGHRAMLIWGTDRQARYWPLEAIAEFDRQALQSRLVEDVIRTSRALCDATDS